MHEHLDCLVFDLHLKSKHMKNSEFEDYDWNKRTFLINQFFVDKCERFLHQREMRLDSRVCLYLLVCFLCSVYIRGVPLFQSRQFCSLLSPRRRASPASWMSFSCPSVPPWKRNQINTHTSTEYSELQLIDSFIIKKKKKSTFNRSAQTETDRPMDLRRTEKATFHLSRTCTPPGLQERLWLTAHCNNHLLTLLLLPNFCPWCGP